MLTFVPSAPSCQRLHAQMMDVSLSILAWPASGPFSAHCARLAE